MGKKIKVLYLTNIPSPYRVDFFNELGKYTDLQVMYERTSAKDRDGNWKGNQALSYKEMFMKGINMGKDSALNPSVIKYLNEYKNEIIIIGGFSTPTGMLAIEYLTIRDIPFIINADGGQINRNFGFKFKLKKHFISSGSAWLSTSKKTDEYFIEHGARLENIYRYPFTSLHNSDILQKVLTGAEKKKIKESLGVDGNKIVLAIGRFIKLKNYDILLRAWKGIDRSNTLCIIGSGPERATYEKIIKDLNLNNVKIIDFKQKEELKYYYMCSDVFVHPTKTDVWGLVINEAMANGLPIITTNACIAGVELIKNNENGFIIPVDDVNNLHESLITLLNDSEMIIKMGEQNLSKISNYTIERMVQKHMEILTNKADWNINKAK